MRLERFLFSPGDAESTDESPDTEAPASSPMKERAVPTNTLSELFEEGDRMKNMLAVAEAYADELEAEVVSRFGARFLLGFREKAVSFIESLSRKGELSLDWVESKGIPLPKSKVGTCLLSGTMAVVGAIPPGGVFLVAFAYVLFRRNAAYWKEEDADGEVIPVEEVADIIPESV